MILNDTQTQQVATYLAAIKTLTAATREELLDHLCCEIEDKLAQGMPFEASWRVTRERWNEDEVQKIHSSTQNSRIMLKLMAACLIMVVIGLFPLQHASPEPREDGLTTESLETRGNSTTLLRPRRHTVPSEVYLPMTITTLLNRIDPPSTNPLANGHELSSPYGDMRHPLTKKKRFHEGVDLRADQGTPVLAAGAGKVLEAGPKGAYGNCIIIVHDEIYQTLYAHLESVDVKAGDYLVAGQTIGTVGSTGVSTGPHLHYEVIKNGKKVNPADYLP